MSNIPRNRAVRFDDRARLAGVWIVLGCAAFGLLLRLIWLQVIDAPRLQQKAKSLQTTTLRPFVPRRTIVDRSDRPVAIDLPTYTIYARASQFREYVPKQGKSKTLVSVRVEPADLARRLSSILQIEEGKLLEKFTDSLQNQRAVIIGSGFSEEMGKRVRKLKVDGLDLQQEKIDYTRVYPHKNTLAEVLGYIGLDDSGQNRQAKAGVEYSQSSLLKREVKEYKLTKTATGDILPDLVTPEMLHTDDLQLRLTVDLRLQYAARKALSAKMAEWNSPRGTAIVMEADTGAIRSLVVEPSYDPNNYAQDVASYRTKVGEAKALSLLRNWAVSDLYEPGSTFKPIAVAIGIENGIVTPTTKIVDNGKISVGGCTIQNFDKKPNGTIDIAQILQRSSNIGMVKVMQPLKADVYYNWLQRIGLGQRTAIDLPSEAQGSLKGRQQFISHECDRANTSFGQGFSVTPIQLVTLMSSLANGGKLVTPHVVEGLFDSTGARKDKPTRPEPRQIFSPKTAQTVLELMETVVTSGSGTKAQIPGYRIAGKTGTAQQDYADDNSKITSFVSILPVDRDRRYVVFVAIDRPKGKEKAYGGNVAAPVAKSIIESLISIERIVPSDPSAVNKPQEQKEEDRGKPRVRD